MYWKYNWYYQKVLVLPHTTIFLVILERTTWFEDYLWMEHICARPSKVLCKKGPCCMYQLKWLQKGQEAEFGTNSAVVKTAAKGQGWHKEVLMWLNAYSPDSNRAWAKESGSVLCHARSSLLSCKNSGNSVGSWFWGANTNKARAPCSTPSNPLPVQVCLPSEQQTTDDAPLNWSAVCSFPTQK